jgi:hypothetical protein
MFGNIIIDIQVILIIGLIIYFFITLYSYLKKSKDARFSDIETETWQRDNQELSIIYKKNNRPDQSKIDDIKTKISQYHEEIISYINQSNHYKKFIENGITLAGFSFPTGKEEVNEFDFSIDYIYSKVDDERFLTAQFKNEKFLKLKVDE